MSERQPTLDAAFPDKVPVGISQCLLGAPVRYDGGHKRSPLCTEILARRFDFIPVCPETGIGLGTPREPIHLVDTPTGIHVRGQHTPTLDVTTALRDFGRRQAETLTELCGYIFMERSPSCGLGNVPVHDAQGNSLNRGSPGLYAREFTRRHPLLPVVEAGHLHDDGLRENFLVRVYAWQRWQALMRQGLSVAGLQDFHARHKYLLMAHRQASYRHLGRLVAAGQHPLEMIAGDYIRELMATLQIPASRGNHGNVLQHLAGYLKKRLDAGARQELQHRIDGYRRGHAPLAAPVALLRQHLQRHPDDYLQRQVYLAPYPPELMPHNTP